MRFHIIIICYFIIALFSEKVNAQLQITFDALCLKDQSVELGYYYGSKTYLKDTIHINNSGLATYETNYREGIYFIQFPDGTEYEFMITEGNHYAFIINNFEHKYVVKLASNRVSEGYDAYNNAFLIILHSIDSLKSGQERLPIPPGNNFQEMLNSESKKIDTLRNHFMSKYDHTFLKDYLLALTPVDISSGIYKSDSSQFLSRLKDYQEHYLDHINFKDDRIIYTPVLTEKINVYLDKIIQQNPNSLTMAVDKLLNASNDKVMYQFLLNDLLRKYGISANIPLHEYLYAHLIENYCLSDTTSIFSDLQTRQLTKELSRIRPALLLNTAPEINLEGSDRKSISLQKLKADYTVIVFWDIDCSKCKRIFEDLYVTLSKYSYLNIAVYTVYTGSNLSYWRSYVSAKTPEKWYNTHEDEKRAAINNYNIQLTPTIFLLDAKKKIIDKNITVSTLDNYFLKTAMNSR